MNTSLPPQKTKVSMAPQRRTATKAKLIRISLLPAMAGLLSMAAAGQAITIDTHGNATTGAGATVDRRFMQIEPTHVELSKVELDTRTRPELLRFLESDQGSRYASAAARHKGLTLVANGKAGAGRRALSRDGDVGRAIGQAGRPRSDYGSQI